MMHIRIKYITYYVVYTVINSSYTFTSYTIEIVSIFVILYYLFYSPRQVLLPLLVDKNKYNS